MLDSIYHMTNTLKFDFWHKNLIILSLCTQRCYGRHNVSHKSINHYYTGLSILLHRVISLPDATSYDKCHLFHDVTVLLACNGARVICKDTNNTQRRRLSTT